MSKRYTVAVVGNPNCGKTTLFNTITGGKQRTGNWPGVTVERIEGDINVEGDTIHLVDLPGIYSLAAISEDEKVARDYILSEEADLIVNIIDASNIERNLYLTTHLIEMGVPMVIILNMKDVAATKEIHVNAKKIGELLGVPVEYVTAVKKSDREKSIRIISQGLKDTPVSTAHFTYENEVEMEISALAQSLKSNPIICSAPERWQAIKLLESDDEIEKAAIIASAITKSSLTEQQQRIEKAVGDDVDILIADGRYGFIHGLVSATVTKGTPQKNITDMIDKIALNRVLGIPVFFGMMYLLFWMTINFGGAFIDFFDGFFGTIFVDGSGALLEKLGSADWLTAIVATGIGGGIQTIATFVPIIFVLFFILSLLEDSGYMARGAFLMDRLMRFIGLPGKAFIPMLVGFGCTVPAIMATRTLDSKRDKILTIFMAPFMSCGARLPVYALFAAAFFPKSGQNVVFALYIIGMVLAVITGLLLKKTIFQGESAPFVMELPPYHAPRLKHVFIHTWDKLKDFIFQAGRVLIVIVALLGFFSSLGTDGSFGNEDSEKSVLTVAGKSVTPLFKPFGVTEENWPASVGLFTGLFAKEVIVGTVNSLYAIEEETKAETADTTQENDSKEKEAPKEEEKFDFWTGINEAFATIPANLSDLVSPDIFTDPFGVNIGDVDNENAASKELDVEPALFSVMRDKFGSWQAAFAYLLFVLVYVPCLVAVAAMKREIGWKYTLFQIVYCTALGWVLATLFFQITVGHNTLLILAGVAGALALVGSIIGFSKIEKRVQ